MAIAGWLLTYLLPFALIASSTVNQGDDSAWAFSFFVLAPIVGLGCLLLLMSLSKLAKYRWLGIYHVLSGVLALKILPSYWQKVTFNYDHIAAGFDESYVNTFEPSTWHFIWAPAMTFLLVFVFVFNALAWYKNVKA